MDDAEYKAEYDKAAAELEAAAQATTARGPDGKFVKAEETKPEPQKTEPEPAKEPEKEPEKPPEPDPITELKTRLEKAEKIAQDNHAWGTRNAQELATLKRAREQEARDAQRPKILDANPELADAVRYVVNDPAPRQQAEDSNAQWMRIVESAHPGIFDKAIDPELERAVLARFETLGGTQSDPLIAIREITATKLALAEQQIGKRFAAEAAKLAQKSAMAVPGAGGSAARGTPSELDEVTRIKNMSPAEFEREVRRVQGY